jgi:hypothetical protein
LYFVLLCGRHAWLLLLLLWGKRVWLLLLLLLWGKRIWLLLLKCLLFKWRFKSAGHT